MTTHYQYLDWPQLPLAMENQLIEFQQTAENLWVDLQQKEYGKYTGHYGLYHVPNYLSEWIGKNLPIDDTWQIKLQAVFPPWLPPHTDTNRLWSYNYLLTDDHAITSWHNCDKKLIESVKFESRRWAKFNNSVLHSVINFKKPRIAVTLYKIDFGGTPDYVQQTKNHTENYSGTP